MKNLTVINVYAGPGAGKSTTSAGLFFLMKSAGYSVELVTEYAKDKVYEGHLGCLEDQIYIFGKQQRRINRLVGHVDFAITDSPLPLSILYNKGLNHTFNVLVMETFDCYRNINFFIDRQKEYVKIGRTQTAEEAIQLDVKMMEILQEWNIPFRRINGDIDAPNNILRFIKGNE